MKKNLSLVLAAVLSLGMYAAPVLAESSNTSNAAPEASNAAETSNTSNAAPVTFEKKAPEKGSVVKVGLGQHTSIAKSKDFSEKGATAQADAIFAAVGLDAEGRIVAIHIDNAPTKVEFNPDGTLKSDVKAEPKTKRDLGYDYGMKKASEIGLEWFEQMDAFEAWCIGKTLDEILAQPAEKAEGASIPAGDLIASVTIGIGDYQAAIKDAVERAVEVEGADNVGLGITVGIGKSKAKKDDKGAVGAVDVTASAVAIKDGKAAKVLLDIVQPKVEYNVDGTVKSDKTAEIKSKQVLGDEYGMKKASEIGKEWYEQAASLTEWMAGKSLEEIKAMETTKKEEKIVPAGDLAASVTVGVADYLKVVEEAYNMANK